MKAEEGIDAVDREQLRIYFEQGCKPSSEWGIGSEYENFIIDIDLIPNLLHNFDLFLVIHLVST